jgi:hypothetical protein
MAMPATASAREPMPSVTASIVTLLAECNKWARRGDARGAVRPGICWWRDSDSVVPALECASGGVLFVTTGGSAPVSDAVLLTGTPRTLAGGRQRIGRLLFST